MDTSNNNQMNISPENQAVSPYSQTVAPYQQMPYEQQAMPQGQMPYGQQSMPQGQMPYGQQPVPQGQGPYQQMPGQKPPKEPPYSPEEMAKAKKLCIMSLIFYAAPLAVSVFLYSIFETSSIMDGLVGDMYSAVSFTFYGAMIASQITGYIFMIIARVKYPKYVFAKVLMWVYIGIFVAEVITTIIMVVLIYVACSTCIGYTGCPS